LARLGVDPLNQIFLSQEAEMTVARAFRPVGVSADTPGNDHLPSLETREREIRIAEGVSLRNPPVRKTRQTDKNLSL